MLPKLSIITIIKKAIMPPITLSPKQKNSDSLNAFYVDDY